MGTLDDVATFTEVVRRGSFKDAAQVLGVSRAAVTKRIQGLEARLEVQLIHRTTRSLRLTDAGQAFFDNVADVPERVEAAIEQAREVSSEPRGRLRVAMPNYFSGAGLQYEAVPAYIAAHPDVVLEIEIMRDPSEHFDAGFDVVVAGKRPHRRFEDTSMRGRQLLRFPVGLFAAPSYLERHGRPSHPAELRAFDCISYTARDWYFETPDGEPIVVHTRGPLTSNSNALIWAATMKGLGIAYAFPIFFDTEVEAGEVETLLEDFTEHAYVDLYVFHPAARYVPRRTRAFIDLLVEHFGAMAL